MPSIIVEAGILTPEKKEALGKEFTEVASRIMGLPPQAFHVYLKENPLENIYSGGISVAEARKKAEK